MPDYTSVLTEIAKAVKTIAAAPNYTWIMPIAVLASASIGYWASQRTIAKQHGRQRAIYQEKKELVLYLLHSEITKRWKGGIRPHLFSFLEMTPLEGLGHLATTEIHREDLLVLKLLSESFSELDFIGDHRLISEIVHAHILLGDLVDVKNHVAQVINERRRMREQLPTSLSEEEVNNKLNESFSEAIGKLWNEFSEKLKAIDEQFDALIPKLGNAANKTNRRASLQFPG